MASEQARLDLEVLTNELELERRKNRDQPHEIRAAEAHKAEALEAKVFIRLTHPSDLTRF